MSAPMRKIVNSTAEQEKAILFFWKTVVQNQFVLFNF